MTTPTDELRYLAFQAKVCGDSVDEQEIVHCVIPAIMRRLGLPPMSIQESDAHRDKILNRQKEARHELVRPHH